MGELRGLLYVCVWTQAGLFFPWLAQLFLLLAFAGCVRGCDDFLVPSPPWVRYFTAPFVLPFSCLLARSRQKPPPDRHASPSVSFGRLRSAGISMAVRQPG